MKLSFETDELVVVVVISRDSEELDRRVEWRGFIAELVTRPDERCTDSLQQAAACRDRVSGITTHDQCSSAWKRQHSAFVVGEQRVAFFVDGTQHLERRLSTRVDTRAGA